jgi:electron transport complex protein RnfB
LDNNRKEVLNISFIVPVALVTGMGLLAGGILTIADKFMAVEMDETAANILAVLPGANCGACGYAGCEDYANALAADKEEHMVKTNLCTPGGNNVAMAISEILGVEFEGASSKFAIMKCSGTHERTKYNMDYQGPPTCKANKLFFRGRGVCEAGCMGFGDCVAVCNYDAIRIINGIAAINKNRCVGCGLCAKACPNKLIELAPETTNVVVGCSSVDTGRVTRQKCTIGCIACKICEKNCPEDAIHVIDNHAVIDYTKCTNCGTCVSKCPRKVIYVFQPIEPKEAVAAEQAKEATTQETPAP